MFVRNGVADPKLSRTGGLAVAVPGLVRGLAELHRWGDGCPWADLLAAGDRAGAGRLSGGGPNCRPGLKEEAWRQLRIPRGRRSSGRAASRRPQARGWSRPEDRLPRGMRAATRLLLDPGLQFRRKAVPRQRDRRLQQIGSRPPSGAARPDRAPDPAPPPPDRRSG